MTRDEITGRVYTKDDLEKAFNAGKDAMGFYHDEKEGCEHYWDKKPAENFEEYFKNLKR